MATDKQITIDTYDKAAEKLAKYFSGIGSRKADIDLVFCFLPKENPKVFEVGCGDGRDAEYITTLTKNYEGTDISNGMLKVAERRLPNAKFYQHDILNDELPKDLDGVFAFAVFLHLDKDEFRTALQRVYDALHEGGVVYITLKHAKSYSSKMVKDEFGERMFYYYSAQDVRDIKGDEFEVLHEEHQLIGSTTWLLMLLQKRF